MIRLLLLIPVEPVDPLPVTSTWAGLATAVATVLTALGGLVVALSVLIPILRNSQKTITKLEEVHVMVNQQRTDSKRYQLALVSALTHAGVDVPADQSLPLPGEPDAPDVPPLPTPLPLTKD